MIWLTLIALVLTHFAALVYGIKSATKSFVIEQIDFILSTPQGSKARAEAIGVLREMCEFHQSTNSSGVWIWLAASLDDPSVRSSQCQH